MDGVFFIKRDVKFILFVRNNAEHFLSGSKTCDLGKNGVG